MRIKNIAIAGLLFILFASGAFAREVELIRGNYLWRTVNPGTTTSLKRNNIVLSSRDSSPGISNRVPLKLAAGDIDLLMIRMKTSCSGYGEVSWRSTGRPFTPQSSRSFSLGAPGREHTYYLDLKSYLREPGLDYLLFFPIVGEGEAEISEFKLIQGEPGERALAAWQEFWGPDGRRFSGTSSFILHSPRLFGQPVFYYLNWLIAAAVIISLLLRRPRWAITLILFFWVLLEASSAVNNWVFFKDDLSFWGKSLEQKREMQNVAGFYDLIKLARAKVPADADYEILADPKHPYSIERAGYYLLPRLRVSPEAEAAYLVIFDLEPGENVLAGYKVIGRSGKKSYILKNKKI
jgi:hypothetical protein